MAKDKQALIDILTATQQIIRYVEDIKKEDFQMIKNRLLFYIGLLLLEKQQNDCPVNFVNNTQ